MQPTNKPQTRKKYRKTLAERRFYLFVEEIHDAETDHDIAMAGFNLLSQYRAFRYEWQEDAVKQIIDRVYGDQTTHNTTNDRLQHHFKFGA